MTHNLQNRFDQFDEAITINGKQAARMDSAYETLRGFLTAKFDLEDSAVFQQGSYANGTAVEPTDGGEYDVDIVCISAGDLESADSALDTLESRLAESDRYSHRISPEKKSCVRLEYAEDDVGKFHVDVVPVRKGQFDAPFDVPRRGEGWHGTSPQEFTDWCKTQGVHFARTVKAAKRWRDEHQSVRGAIKSIVLQVLVSYCMPQDTSSDGKRLTSTLQSMSDMLAGYDSPPAIINPVLPGENLAKRWTQESYDDFRQELKDAADLATHAYNAEHAIDAIESWRELLGDDFPAEEPSNLGLTLSDDSHAESPSHKGWVRALDPRYKVAITATEQRGKRSKKFSRYKSGERTIFAGRKLRFNATTAGPRDAEVWWQVANTGSHARERQGLRGQYFKAKRLNDTLSPIATENWEDTSFTGAHWIRSVLVKNGAIVAESEKFVVHVYDPRRWFGL